MLQIYQDIELSLTGQPVPPTVHVKQFDHMARKVRCTLCSGSVEYAIPSDVVIAYSGTRPDGRLFQYSTEALVNDKVEVSENRIIITVTDFMTEVTGRYPVDVVMLTQGGDVLGSFSFILCVDRAAVKNGRILTATYASVAGLVREGVFECFTTEDGCFGVTAEDGLDIREGSHSDILEKVCANLVEAGINDGGYLEFETDERLGLAFSMDDEGNLIVEYGEEG